jgi:hypothetical protein
VASIARASRHHGTFKHQAKHFFYASGWKKFEPLWDLIIRARQLTRVTPLLEGVLSRVTRAGKVRPTKPVCDLFPIISSETMNKTGPGCNGSTLSVGQVDVLTHG